MSKPAIEPSKVVWKYFRRDESGNIICSNERPQDLPVLAVLNTSSWIWGRTKIENGGFFAVGAPAKMKQVIRDSLNLTDDDGHNPNFCIAVPCKSVEEMREFYGAQNIGEIEDDYVSLYLYDDLRQGAKNFTGPGFGAVGTMPAFEGAEQIASAIENGFNIWMMAGGNSLFPKLQLCEKYFAQNPPPLDEKKSHFIGFSDGSTSQFYLRGLMTPLHFVGISKAIRKESDQEARKILFALLEGREDQKIRREFSSGQISEVEARYKSMVSQHDVITNLTYFPRQLRVACDTTFPKFRANEKLILSLEGYSQSSVGHNASEVLFKALSCGAIDPKKVIFISIEEIVQKSEELEIVRKNGLIPDFEKLSESEKTTVKNLARQYKLEPQAYIEKSNAASSAEFARIREVGKLFGIPVVEGGERRAGHGGNPLLIPSLVSHLEFADGKMVQVSDLCAHKREFLPSNQACSAKSSTPNWPAFPQVGEDFFYESEYEYSKAAEVSRAQLGDVKLLPLNDVKIEVSENEKLVGGNVLNVVERPISEIAGKGLFLHLPYKNMNKGSNPFSDLFHLVASDRLQAAKFVVLSMEIPADEKFTNCTREEYLENRNKIFAKLFSDFRFDKPLFVTRNSTKEKDLPVSFDAEIDLKKAIAPETLVAGHSHFSKAAQECAAIIY